MSAAKTIAAVAACVQSAEALRQKKLLHSYLEVVNYLFRKSSSDQAIAEINTAILQYSQPTSMTPM